MSRGVTRVLLRLIGGGGAGTQLSVLTVFISDGNLFYTDITMWQSQVHKDYNVHMRQMDAAASSGHGHRHAVLTVY